MPCGDCKFYFERRPNEGFDGQCRAHPPTLFLTDTVEGYWPEVDKHDWCGEYKPRVNLEDNRE